MVTPNLIWSDVKGFLLKSLLLIRTLLKTMNSGSPPENSPDSIRLLNGEVLDRPLQVSVICVKYCLILIDYTASGSISFYIHSVAQVKAPI